MPPAERRHGAFFMFGDHDLCQYRFRASKISVAESTSERDYSGTMLEKFV